MSQGVTNRSVNFAELQYRQNFSIDEFAAWENTSRSTVYREIAEGNLRTIRVRGRRFVPREEADRRRAERLAAMGRLQ